MVHEVFVICDGANDSQGKLNILGAFDSIIAQEFPFVHPHCVFVLRLRIDHNDGRESAIRLILRHAAEETVLASVDTTLKHDSFPNPTMSANLIVNINALRFEKPGDYAFTLEINGMPAAIAPLYVRQAKSGSIH